MPSKIGPGTPKRLSNAIRRGCIRAYLSRPPEMRSEEHTSELQSLMRISYAVFCLKKNNISNVVARLRIVAVSRKGSVIVVADSSISCSRVERALSQQDTEAQTTNIQTHK